MEIVCLTEMLDESILKKKRKQRAEPHAIYDYTNPISTEEQYQDHNLNCCSFCWI